MSEQTEVKPGDWVAFQREARVVYGRVDYVKRDSLYRLVVITTVGEVDAERVLEVRRG